MKLNLNLWFSRLLVGALTMTLSVPASLAPRMALANAEHRPFNEIYSEYYAAQLSKNGISRSDTEKFIREVMQNPPSIDELKEFAHTQLPPSVANTLDGEFEKLAAGELSAAEFQEVLAKMQRSQAAQGLTWDCGGLGMLFFALPFLALVGIIAGIVDIIQYGTNKTAKIERDIKEQTDTAEKRISTSENDIEIAITQFTTYDQANTAYTNWQNSDDYYRKSFFVGFYGEMTNILKYVNNPSDRAAQLEALKKNYLGQLAQQRKDLASIRSTVENEYSNGVPFGLLKIGGGAVATVLTLTCF